MQRPAGEYHPCLFMGQTISVLQDVTNGGNTANAIVKHHLKPENAKWFLMQAISCTNILITKKVIEMHTHIKSKH